MGKQDDVSLLTKKELERELRSLRAAIQIQASAAMSLPVSSNMHDQIEAEVINSFRYIQHFDHKLEHVGDELIATVTDIKNAALLPVPDDYRHRRMVQLSTELGTLSIKWRNAYVEMAAALPVEDEPVEENKMFHFLSDLQTALGKYIGKRDIEPLKMFFGEFPAAANLIALQDIGARFGRPKGQSFASTWIARRLYELKRKGEKRTYSQIAQEILLPELPHSGLNPSDAEECRRIISSYNTKMLGTMVGKWKRIYEKSFI